MAMWQSGEMLLTLNIDQIAQAKYRAVVTQGGVEVVDGEMLHASIADAIQCTACDVPPGFAHFIEPRFAGVTCGTLRISEAAQPACAEEAARKIVALVGDMHALGLA
jgi:hypothetical protein